MSRPLTPHEEGRGRGSEECRRATVVALRAFATWALAAAIAIGTGVAVTRARMLLPPQLVGIGFAICVVCILTAGVAAGFWLGRWLNAKDRSSHSDAGDSHAGFVPTQPTDQAPLVHLRGSVYERGNARATRRVRAGHPPPLKFSYDGRKRTGQVP